MAFNAPHWNPRLMNVMAKRSKNLRKHQTPIEKKLKKYLQEMGIAYDFQVVIGRYIVDFLLMDYDLVLEADGAYHDKQGQKDKDRIRDMDLKDKGFQVVRIKGWQIWNEAVCKGFLKDLLNGRAADARLLSETQGLQTLAVASDGLLPNQRKSGPALSAIEPQ